VFFLFFSCGPELTKESLLSIYCCNENQNKNYFAPDKRVALLNVEVT